MTIYSMGLGDDERLGVPPKTACEMIGCGITTLYELLAAQELESYQIGRARRVTTDSIRSFVRRQVERGKAA